MLIIIFQTFHLLQLLYKNLHLRKLLIPHHHHLRINLVNFMNFCIITIYLFIKKINFFTSNNSLNYNGFKSTYGSIYFEAR